jgi:hypothetical protein
LTAQSLALPPEQVSDPSKGTLSSRHRARTLVCVYVYVPPLLLDRSPRIFRHVTGYLARCYAVHAVGAGIIAGPGAAFTGIASARRYGPDPLLAAHGGGPDDCAGTVGYGEGMGCSAAMDIRAAA